MPVPGKKLCVVIGTGSIGLRHLTLMAHGSEVRVMALPVRPARGNELTAQGFRVLESLKEAVDLGVTHAVIATDTGRHGADAVAALEMGCHVLVEKPMDTHSAAAARMLEVARAAGRGLWVGCCLRFQEALNRFRDRLPAIGRVHAVRIESQSYLPDWRINRPYRDSYSAQAVEGGVLRDLIHEIDYAGWLFGWPQSVQARIRNLGRLGIDAEEAADLFWETEAGGGVSLRLDYLSQPPRRKMRAFGDRGTIEWDGLSGILALSPLNGPVQRIVSQQTRDQMYLAQDLAFLDACGVQPDPRLAAGEDGVRALAVCDAARRASESRREEPVCHDE